MCHEFHTSKIGKTWPKQIDMPEDTEKLCLESEMPEDTKVPKGPSNNLKLKP